MANNSSPADVLEKCIVKVTALYNEVNKLVIETEQKTDGYPIALINEMRYALDHVFQVTQVAKDSNDSRLKDSEAVHSQFVNVSRHLKRCGHDALEHLINQAIQDCWDVLHKFEAKTVYAVIPDYAQRKVIIESVENRLTESRTMTKGKTTPADFQKITLFKHPNKVPGEEYDTYYPEFKKILFDIREQRDFLISHEPALIEYQNNLDSEKSELATMRKRDSIKNIALFILSVLIAAIFFWAEMRMKDFEDAQKDKTIDPNELPELEFDESDSSGSDL